LIVRAAHGERRLWADMLAGEPGFMRSPNPTQLRMRVAPAPGDPLNDAWRDGSHIGCLGIALRTRRRNRLNGVMALDDDGAAFTVEVHQSFGNCPQYIQARQPRLPRSPSAPGPARKVRLFTAWRRSSQNRIDRRSARYLLECADDCLPPASLGRIECDDGIVKGRDGADVRPRPSVPHTLDDLTEMGAIGSISPCCDTRCGQ
jgi:hypothetical protein